MPEDAAYFHAQFRRTNPLPYKRTTPSSTACRGKGQYVGTYMAWGVNNTGWWGEGEIKFFMDGDGEFPTICGTGTEDYFCGAYNFDGGISDPNMASAYTRVHHALRRPAAGASGRTASTSRSTRFGMYRWHIIDPIRFDADLRVTIQALGWRTDKASGATCRCRTTSPRSPSGIRRCRPRRSRRCPTATISR